MYKVLLVDDQKSSRDLLSYTMADSKAYNIVNTLCDADAAPDYCRANTVDLVLMDIHTNGKENGLLAAKQIKELRPATKVIIVTFMVRAEHINIARQIGCEGFWYKDHSKEKLLEVIDSVMAGATVYPDSAPVITIGMAKSTEFTKQELRVLQAKVNGYSNSETCEKLGISVSTLNFHISNLKSKTGYSSLLQLTADVVMQRFIIAERLDD